jgi:Eph receptor A1
MALIQQLMNKLFDSTDDTPHRIPVLERTLLVDRIAIGVGHFSQVYKGSLLSLTAGTAKRQVAIKEFKAVDARAIADLLEEAKIMVRFAHPHIVGLVGVVTVGLPVLLVSDLCINGDLLHYLRRSQLLYCEKLRISREVALALNFLHMQGYVHRDIAARNVLLDENLVAKISDFGMCRQLSSGKSQYESSHGVVAFRWASPEAINFKTFSRASDVWSFGVLVSLVLSLPYRTKVFLSYAHGVLRGNPLTCLFLLNVDVRNLQRRRTALRARQEQQPNR